jgi:DNA modification methylase
MTQHPLPRGNGYAASRDLHPRLIDLGRLRPLGRPTRRHPAGHIRKLKASIEQFGFVLPIVIDEVDRVVAGWGLVLAARRLGLAQVPAVTLSALREAELRALRLALNRLAEDSSWDVDELALELSDILELDGDIDLQISGFEIGEIDGLLDENGAEEEHEIAVADEDSQLITRPADIWLLGSHRIICADGRDPTSYDRLLKDEKAQQVFADPPHHVRRHSNGSGWVPQAELTMASGEMSPAEFQNFLQGSLAQAVRHCVDGAIHFICTDWRYLHELLAVTKEIYSEMMNLCVWNKTTAEPGSFYKFKHELVFVFKVGTAPHIHHVGRGRHDRDRTNVWDYACQDTLKGTKSRRSPHLTGKPVALIADAIRDCSDRDGIILDPFGGGGTTLIAAERTGRRARLIEISPRYIDFTVKRWQQLTGGSAVHAVTGEPFGHRPPCP